MRNRLLNQSHLIVAKRLIVTMLVDKANVYQKERVYTMSVKSKNKKSKGFKGALNLLPGETLVARNGIVWKRKASK